MDGNSRPPKPSLHRSSSRLKQVYHRFLRRTSGTLTAAHSIKAAEPSPLPVPLAPSLAAPSASAASRSEPTPPNKATDADADSKLKAGSHGKTGEKPKASKWNLLRPVKNLLKAYVKFMMAPIPDEGSMPAAGAGAEGYISVTNTMPRVSLAERDRLHLETLRRERERYDQQQRQPSYSQWSSPSPHALYPRRTQSGPLPRASCLSREDSRRYSGELRKRGELKRRTPQELARDAIVGVPVVFGPGEPTPPPRPAEQVVAPISDFEDVAELEEDTPSPLPQLEGDGPGKIQHFYVYKQPGRLSAVAEEAGTPRGVSLR